MRLLLSVLIVLGVSACGTNNAPAAPSKQKIAEPWVYDSVTRVWMTCTVYGDRLYSQDDGLAVVPGGCAREAV